MPEDYSISLTTGQGSPSANKGVMILSYRHRLNCGLFPTSWWQFTSHPDNRRPTTR